MKTAFKTTITSSYIIYLFTNTHSYIILRVFISFTKQFFTFHSIRIKCEKQILPSVGFEPTTFCIRGKRLTARFTRLTSSYMYLFIYKYTFVYTLCILFLSCIFVYILVFFDSSQIFSNCWGLAKRGKNFNKKLFCLFNKIQCINRYRHTIVHT